MTYEKNKGPSFRHRWKFDSDRMLRRYRYAPIIGAQKKEEPSAQLSQTFRSLVFEKKFRLSSPGERYRRGANWKICSPRKSLRAEKGAVLQRAEMRRRIDLIPRPETSNESAANLYFDMLDSKEVKSFVRADIENAYALYAALCNTDWKKGDDVWGCSWRSAGGMVANLRNQYENYLTFYCSGNEGEVRDDVGELIKTLGWQLIPYKEES